MQSRQNFTIVGVFKNDADAHRAVEELYAIGLGSDQIGIARRGDEPDIEATIAANDETGSGAVTGAVTGLGLGALAGLGVVSGVLPVVGPAIAAGTLGVVLSNAAAGAGIAGLIGALVGAGVPEHEARYYHDELAAGRTILTVNTIHLSREAGDVLKRNGAYDLTSRSTTIDQTEPADLDKAAVGAGGHG